MSAHITHKNLDIEMFAYNVTYAFIFLKKEQVLAATHHR